MFSMEMSSNSKKIIGISGHIVLDSTLRTYPNIEKVYVNNPMVLSVLEAGAIPIIIPMNEDLEVIRQQVALVDGLIIAGGCDVNPLSYGEEPSNHLRDILPAKDNFDFSLIRYANDMRIPLFGICRGLQIINVYYGGTLYQDNTLLKGSYIKHRQECRFDIATHSIDIESGSWLSSILGLQSGVNSFHHQSICKLAAEFKVLATAKDGVIEAIEKEGNVFCSGVQWHPETMISKYESMLNIFKFFVTQCRKIPK